MNPDLKYQVFCLLLLGDIGQSVSCRRPKRPTAKLITSSLFQL